MNNDYYNAMKKYFLEEAEIEAVLAWSKQMPTYPGKTGDSLYYLQMTISAVQLVTKFAFEEASELLDQIEDKTACKMTYKLISQWVRAEIDPINNYYDFIDDLIDEFEKEQFFSGDKIYSIDHQVALTLAHMLRFLVSSQYAIPEEYDEEAYQTDLHFFKTNNCPHDVIIWVEAMHAYIDAEADDDFDRMEQLSIDWIELCKRGRFDGDETEYVELTIIKYESRNRNEEAFRLIDRAIEVCTDKEQFLILKLRVQRRHGEFNNSSETGEALLSLFPDSFMGYCLLTQNKLAENKQDEALELAEIACGRFPDSADCHINRAFIYFQLERYEEALADFEISQDSDQYKYDSQRGIGRCLVLMKRTSEAIEYFCELSRKYQDPEIYFELADLYFDDGWIDDAGRMCRKCLELDPSFSGAYFHLGTIAEIEGKDEKAISLFEKTLEIEPAHTAAMTALALLLQAEGESDRALDLVEQALDTTPDYADAMYAKGNILFCYGDYQEAEEFFDRALENIPDHVPALAAKGNSLVQLGEYDEAQISLDQALELDPDNLDACHGKLSLCRELGLEFEQQLWQKRIIKIENRIGDYDKENGQDYYPDQELNFDDYDEFDDL